MSQAMASGGARVWLVLTVAALFATVARSAGLNVPPDSNTQPVSKQAKVQSASTPSEARATLRQPNRTPASFTPEMSFGDAIDILRNCTRPPLNIVVLWKEIGENAGVYRDTPIGINGVTGLRIRQYLDMLVLSVSAGVSARLGYVVNDGVIIIGTTDALPTPKRVTRVYDVSDLVAEPAHYFFLPMGFGGIGYGGLYGGGSMMGLPGGAGGGFGAGYAPRSSYLSTSPYGAYGDRGLSGMIGTLHQGARQPRPYRR